MVYQRRNVIFLWIPFGWNPVPSQGAKKKERSRYAWEFAFRCCWSALSTVSSLSLRLTWHGTLPEAALQPPGHDTSSRSHFHPCLFLYYQKYEPNAGRRAEEAPWNGIRRAKSDIFCIRRRADRFSLKIDDNWIALRYLTCWTYTDLSNAIIGCEEVLFTSLFIGYNCNFST